MLEKLSDQVGGLEESKSEWEALAREILSTITLEGNKEVFALLPEDWHRMVSAWVNRFHVIEAAEQSVQSDECPGSSDGKHEFYQGSAWRICAHCGTRR